MKSNHIAIAICFVLTACNSGIDQNRDQTTAQPKVEKITTAPAAGTANPVTKAQLQPAAITLPTAATAATKGLNPAHGLPGHDCALAVGAPLNAAPVLNPSATVAPVNMTSTTPVPVPQQNVSPVTSQSVQASPFNAKPPQLGGANVKATKGLNPAHGQAGHDCAVAVGAPLKQ